MAMCASGRGAATVSVACGSRRPRRKRSLQRPSAWRATCRRASLSAVTARQIMTADDVRRALIRISHEIVEKHGGTDGLALVGVQTRGVPLAERLATSIAEHEGVKPPV